MQDPCVYLSGNSLGLMHSKSKAMLEQEVGRWENLYVIAKIPLLLSTSPPTAASMVILHRTTGVGSTKLTRPTLIWRKSSAQKNRETACMGTLTANLHLLMNVFYRPTEERYKILCESRAFPSDQVSIISLGCS